MPVYLDEDCIGGDPAEIAYPHLLLCVGVTVMMSDGRLFGAHVSNGTTEDTLLAELKKRIGSQVSKPARMYVIGNQAVHQSHGGKTAQAKAAALGFKGPLNVYDTVRLNPTDGSFARVVSSGGTATVYAMKDELARPYTVTQGASKFVSVYDTNKKVFTDVKFYKTGYSGHPVAALTAHDFDSATV